MRPVTPFMITPSRTVSTVSSPVMSMRGRRSAAQRRERCEIRHRTGGETGAIERAQIDLALAQFQANATVSRFVKRRMRAEERLLFFGARALAGKAVDVMMAVALDM